MSTAFAAIGQLNEVYAALIVTCQSSGEEQFNANTEILQQHMQDMWDKVGDKENIRREFGALWQHSEEFLASTTAHTAEELVEFMFRVKSCLSVISALLIESHIADHTAKAMESQMLKLMEKINATQSIVATLTGNVTDIQSELTSLSQKREEANRRKAELRVQQGQTSRSTRHDIGTSSPPDEASMEEADIDEDAADDSVGSGVELITFDPALNKVLVQKLYLKNAELAVKQKSVKQQQMEAKKQQQQQAAAEKKRKAAEHEQWRTDKLEKDLAESRAKKLKLDAEVASSSSSSNNTPR